MPRGGRGLHPDRALEISLTGNAQRFAEDGVPTLDAVAVLRDLAGGRIDLLARAAGSAIGGYLGTSLANPINLPAAHLLVLAGAYEDHASIVAAADEARRNAGSSAYSN